MKTSWDLIRAAEIGQMILSWDQLRELDMAKNDDFLGMDETRRREKQRTESQKKLMGLPNFLLLLWEPIIADFARPRYICAAITTTESFSDHFISLQPILWNQKAIFSFVSEIFTYRDVIFLKSPSK